VSSEGVPVPYVKNEIIPEFLANFWERRNAIDKKNYKQLIETTVEIAMKVEGAYIIKKIVNYLKDESESYRKIVMETIEKIVSLKGVADFDVDLEKKLIDGILFAFQEQASEDTQTVLNAFGTIVNCLGSRTKNYIPRICGTI
jgi:splicing factor 3B subunit 1